jgi:acyl transferase domain-containing protein
MSLSLDENAIGGAEPIAMVGVGCKLPGNINSTADLIAALQDGRDMVTDVPRTRWNMEAFYDPDPMTPGKTYVRKGSFVEDIDTFDAGFFGISDAEALRMDPQQRLVLEVVWHALEDAGQTAEELMNSNTGVFLAMMNTNGYSQLKGIYEGPLGITGFDALGDAMSISAGRISHFLGLEGPCLTVDTACSSSLVALHLARQSILSQDCDTAIVVGVNVMLHPGLHIAFSKVGLMSRTGRCAAFDASADGYIRGEGCVAVVLRRQSVAVARGDNIYASIVGTAVNQDGHTPALTAPNGRSQEKVIRSALARTGVSPNDIGYLEAHGTGTPVGDPIEMSAIVNVFGPNRPADNPLFVGSVKSNFGHLEAGAGLLGLVKAALSLKHEEILPSLHFTQLNPGIDLGHAPIEVATRRIPWQRNGKPRLASINSFGYSGTNAHTILQEAPISTNGNTPQVASGLVEGGNGMLVLSAKSATALEELVDKWVEFLAKDTPQTLRDILYSAALDRTQLSYRLAVIGTQKEEFKSRLESWRMGRIPQGLSVGQNLSRIRPRLAFMFTGQGAQYARMGQELYRTEPRFAETLNRVAAVIDRELGVPLLEVLFGEKSAEYLENTRYVQPALFAIEYALGDLLNHWGIKPDYVIGHSIGELVAACFAGMLDMEDAARFVVVRGRLMGQLPAGGKMLSIGATLEQVQKWVVGRETEVAIATVNGPRAVVVSGTAAAVAAIDELAQAGGRKTKELEVSHAFHSPLMEPILDELTQAAACMNTRPPSLPIAANVSGDFFGDDIPASYWSNQVRQTVLFHRGMEKIIDEGCTILVEIGPHPQLSPAVATAFDAPNLQIIPTLKRDKSDTNNLLGSLAALYVGGAGLNLDRLFNGAHYQHVSLPLYPFRREKYWLKSTGILDVGPADYPIMNPGTTVEELPVLPALHPLLGKVLAHTARKAVFETSFKTSIPWTDHRVLESTIFPGTGYLEMAGRGFAAASGLEWRAVEIKDVVFERPLVLSYKEARKLTLTLEFGTRGRDVATFTITSDEITCCRGRILAAKPAGEKADLSSELSERSSELKIGPFYNELRISGLDFGANFANLRELWLGKPGSGEAFGRVANGPGVDESDPFRSAILLDSCLHPLGAAMSTFDSKGQEGAVVQTAIQSITIHRPLMSQAWSHVRASPTPDGRAALGNLRVMGEDGEVLVSIENLELRRMTSLNGGKESSRSNGKGTAAQFFKSRQELVKLLTPLARRERIGLLSRWLTSEIKDIMGQAAEGLSLDKLPPSTAFLEIGLDSLLVTELQRRIQEKLEFRFKPMQGLDYQSIESLANYILSDVLAADLASVSSPEPASIPSPN